VRRLWRLPPTALALALACSAQPQDPVGEPAPPFELERLSGGRVKLEDLRGKTVLVDFWATWCAPCVVEIPELNAIWEERRGSDVEILAISVDTDGPEVLRDWIEEKGVLYPVVLGDLDLALAYGAEQFPYHLVIGPDGTVLERLPPGYHDREELRDLLARHRAS
jgi:peroxiredoxin